MPDPLSRYVKDAKAFRKILNRVDALLVNSWSAAAFFEDEPPLSREHCFLDIRVHKSTDWTPIQAVLQDEGYRLHSTPQGAVLFMRNKDKMGLRALPFPKHWENPDSLESKLIRNLGEKGVRCFMTSKYAVIACPSSPMPGDELNHLSEILMTKYEKLKEAREETQVERWNLFDNKLFGIVDLSEDVPVEPGSFNEFLSNGFPRLPSLVESMRITRPNST